MLQVEQSITTPLEHLQSVVEAFDKAATFPVDEVIQDFVPPTTQGIDKVVKASQPTLGDPLDPGLDFDLRQPRGDQLIKDRCQLFLQDVSQLQLGRMEKETSHHLALCG